ncbi:MAG: ArnT family glycosyltransferase [Solirubrobacteraceae bacterium]
MIRLVYVSVEPYHAINDAGTYNRFASMIANHGDYHTGDKPRSGAGGSRGPTAYFPPAFPYYLAIADLIDGHAAGGPTAVAPERVEMAVTGTIAVALIGLVALEAFGDAVALAAMALAAVYPVLIELSGTLVAENLLVVFELAAAWTLLRAREATHPYAWIVAGGVFCGLGALTHENALLYVIPLGFAAWTVARRRPNRTRSGLRALAAPTTLLIITCATIAPWTIRNAVELHAFVPISDEAGITLAGTYNPVSAAFEPVPWKWHLFSHVPEFHHLEHISGRFTEVALGDKLETAALDYIKAHPLAPLEVAYHNTLRMLELEGTYAWQASAKALDIHINVARVGVWAFYVLALLALAGAFTAAARRAPRWLWAMPVLYALSIVFVNVETPRFREPIDPFLIMLAGCAVVAALGRLSGPLRLRRAPVGRRRRPSQLPADA